MARRHVALIVRTEVRRRLRALGDDARRGIAYALSGLVFGIFGILAVGGAYVAGRAVGDGEFGSALSAGSAAAAGLLALVLFMTTVRAIQQTAVPDHPEGLLLAARHRDVVAGTLVVESLLPLGAVGLPGVLAGVTFAAGAGSPTTALLVAVAVLSIVAVGTVLGFAAGLAVRLAVARSAFLARYRTGIGLLVAFGYLGVVYGSGSTDVFGPVIRVLAATPLAWFGDIALLGLAPDASPIRVSVALLATVVAFAGLLGATSRLADRLWYGAPVEPRSRSAASWPASLPGVGRRTELVVRKSWTRALRSPIRLIYVAYPLLFALGPVATSFGDGVPAAAATSLAVYGAWATGAAFTLNPIGDETPVLPVTLTSTVTGRRFVRALWLAGSAPGVPLTLALSAGTGVLAGLGVSDLVLVAALAVGLPALVAGVGAGVGAAFPRVQPARITRSRQAVVPSLVAFGVYSVLLFIFVVPAWLAVDGTPRRLVANALGFSPLAVGVAGVGAAVVLLAGAAHLSFRNGARRFDRYTIA